MNTAAGAGAKPDAACSAAPGTLTIDEAFARLDAGIRPLPAEHRPLREALGRVLAEPVLAACDLPPFDQSAMDGYALRAADIAAAPVTLRLAAVVAAGVQLTAPEVPVGCAARIYTGGLIPPATDTVVPQELTEPDGAGVRVLQALAAGSHCRRRGEELRRGSVLAPPGRRVDAGMLAALSAAGVAELRLRRAPRVRVLVSGDEIVPPGQALRPGEVYDANGPLVVSWFMSRGMAAPQVERVVDEVDAVRAALQRGFDETDLLLTTGGVSVGDRDLIAPQAEALGAERLLWKVAQKPGKPLFVARRDGCLLLGLPGNPGAVAINLATFVRRALDLLEGLAKPGPDWRRGRLAVDARPDARRETWMRMQLRDDEQGHAVLQPLPRQASHMLSNLVEADVLARLPAGDAPLPAGSVVRWLSLR